MVSSSGTKSRSSFVAESVASPDLRRALCRACPACSTRWACPAVCAAPRSGGGRSWRAPRSPGRTAARARTRSGAQYTSAQFSVSIYQHIPHRIAESTSNLCRPAAAMVLVELGLGGRTEVLDGDLPPWCSYRDTIPITQHLSVEDAGKEVEPVRLLPAQGRHPVLA